MHKRAAAAIVAVAAVLGAGLVQSVTPAAAQPQPLVHRFAATGDSTVLPRASASPNPVGDCGQPSATPVPDGQPIVVSLPPAPTFTVGAISAQAWSHPMVNDPTWRLNFEGFMYLEALVARAYLDGSTQSLTTMVNQLVAFHTQNPDPGTLARGWDEGTAQRRLQAEICAYDATQDSRLIKGMVADAAVQMGPRYDGPPYQLVHNHGLMANLRLIRAGQVINKPAWISFALQRLVSEAPKAFSSTGLTWEQSSSYQKVNLGLWNNAAAELASQGGSYATTAAAIRRTTAKARVALAWLTEPDGNLVQIGDSDVEAGVTRTSTARVFRDDAAGYVVGRWSWSDPVTSYYTLRYGPRRWAHGQFDRGSLTWSTLGARVLVGPGRFNYSATGFGPYRRLPVAHNVAVPAVGTYRDWGAARVIASTIRSNVHQWQMADTLYGVTHTRAFAVYPSTHRLVVADTYPASAGGFRQYWHLAPEWKLVSAPVGGTRMVFRNASGLRLTITTTGRVSGAVAGATRPIAGWNFPRAGSRVPAYQLTIRSVTSRVTTTFVVTRAAA